MASISAAVPFWRSAGITYVAYSNVCANLLRNCLKEPHKSEVLTRGKVHFSRSKWTNGKPQKPTNYELFSFIHYYFRPIPKLGII